MLCSYFFSPTQSWKHLGMPKLWKTTIPGELDILSIFFLFLFLLDLQESSHDCMAASVVLVNLSRSNLISMGKSLGLQFVHIFSKGHVFAKSLTQKGTIIAFTCSVQHHQRWLHAFKFHLTHHQLIYYQVYRQLAYWSIPFQDVKKFKLGDPRSFHYLNQTNCYEVANVNDAREYLETRNAMDVVGISQDEQVLTLWHH